MGNPVDSDRSCLLTSGYYANPSDGLHAAFCASDTLEIAEVDWCWMQWPQAKQSCDERTRVGFFPSISCFISVLQAYVDSLDIEADIALLRSHLAIREPCLNIMRRAPNSFLLCFFSALHRITGRLLQKGIRAGLTLYQIGCILTRHDIDLPSQLEVLCAQAKCEHTFAR